MLRKENMPRYAIYFVPEPSTPLWHFGSAALGYNAQTGQDAPFPDHPVFAHPDVRTWTEEPRRYGFHGTLKAPFELHAEAHEAALIDAARAFASRREAILLPSFEIGTLGRFLALTPAGPSPALNDLAAACVREFDRFRAPMSPMDRERRLTAPLSPRQIEYLDAWGYPYVMEEFRFHVTLSGALDDGPRTVLLGALTELYAKVAAPLAIDSISVCKQERRDDRFVVLRRFQLGG
jgi:putative phosphonate metabolism protein